MSLSASCLVIQPIRLNDLHIPRRPAASLWCKEWKPFQEQPLLSRLPAFSTSFSTELLKCPLELIIPINEFNYLLVFRPGFRYTSRHHRGELSNFSVMLEKRLRLSRPEPAGGGVRTERKRDASSRTEPAFLTCRHRGQGSHFDSGIEPRLRMRFAALKGTLASRDYRFGLCDGVAAGEAVGAALCCPGAGLGSLK